MPQSGALESNSQGTEKNVGESKRENSNYSNTEKELLSQSNFTTLDVGDARDAQSSKREDGNKGYNQVDPVKNTADEITEKQNKESNLVKDIYMAGEGTSSVQVSPDEIRPTPPATNISAGLLEKGTLSKLDCKENVKDKVVKDKDLNLEEMASVENTATSANGKPKRTLDQTAESESLHLKNNENTGVNQGFRNRPYIKKEPSQALNTTKMSPDVQTTDDKEYIYSSTRDRNNTENTEAIQAGITERTEINPNVEINYEKDNISSKTSNTDTKEEIKDEGNERTEKGHDLQTTDEIKDKENEKTGKSQDVQATEEIKDKENEKTGKSQDVQTTEEIKDKRNERTEKSHEVQIIDETKDKGNGRTEKSHDIQITDETKDKGNETTEKSHDVQITDETKDKGNERTEKSHDVQITDETKDKENETTEKSLDVQTTDDRENSSQTSDADTAPVNKDKLHKNDVHFDDGEEEKDETKQRAQKTKQNVQNKGMR